MADYPDLLILRHGETEWNTQGRMQGTLDSPLTARGRAQARAQNGILRQLKCGDHDWFSSPQGRAIETARIVQQGLVGDLAVDQRLAEIGMGHWTGRARHEIANEAPHLFAGSSTLAFYDHAPGGEGLAALAERTQAFLADLSAPAVVVTHGITSRVIRCLAMDLPVTAFGALQGGQGIVYAVSKKTCTLISETGVTPQPRPTDFD